MKIAVNGTGHVGLTTLVLYLGYKVSSVDKDPNCGKLKKVLFTIGMELLKKIAPDEIH